MPIPKTQQSLPAVDDLRPLCLLEALRKVWTRVILKKITTAWTRHEVIHETQHGFVPGRSTATATLQHLNAIEEAQELDVPIHRSSWDMKRAFDSVSTFLKFICWIRGGVPLEVAEYMVHLDHGGTTVVKSPWATTNWTRDGYGAMQGNTPKEAKVRHKRRCVRVFRASRGAGQGDVSSPIVWAAAVDILNRALAMEGPLEGFYARMVDGEMELVIETTYADDMESKTATAAALQRKALIVQGFCHIFGITFSESKLRRTTSTWGQSIPTPPLLVGTPTQQIPVQTQGYTTYLGVPHDLDNSGNTALHCIVDTAKAACAALMGAKASPETKLAVAISSTISKTLYIARLSNHSLAQLHKIDTIFDQFWRTITSNGITFPKALIHIHRCHGGLGIPAFSTKVVLAKLRLMYTSLSQEGRIKRTMEALLSRGVRETGDDWTDRAQHTLTPPFIFSRNIWARALLEYMDH